MLLHYRGGGVGHTSTRSATDKFLKDCDQLDQDNRRTQGHSDSGNEDDGKNEPQGHGDDDSSSENLGGSGSDDGSLQLEGSDEEVQVDDAGEGSGDSDEEEDYGYGYAIDDEGRDDSDAPPDDADDALGPEDGEGETDEVNILGFALF